MLRRIAAAFVSLAIFCPSLGQSPACSICTGMANVATLREDAANAKLIVYGTLSNPRLNAAAPGAGSDGAATDLNIERVIKPDPILAGRTVITLPRYVPVDPKSPPRFLVICDVAKGKIDPYRGCPSSPAIAQYLVGGMAMNPSDSTKLFAYFGGFLDHADPEIAGDAYRELSRAGDADVARAAKQLDPARLRKLLTDPATPAERLSLFAYLLGSCGTAADADLLARLLAQSDDRVKGAIGGLLAGYTQLRPDDGWRMILAFLADAKQPFPRRMAALGTVRFFYRSQPASRARTLQAIATLLPQGDLADLAIEDLRLWKEWGQTIDVLGQYGKKSHSAPMIRRAIVRYALCCPRPEAKQFVEQLRQSDRQLVQDVQESLEFEKATPGTANR
jgi:hypothetical protein